MSGQKLLKKVLIANRGEIARRIQKTAREMGIRTVAIHSDADKQALFVLEADEAIPLSGNQPEDTYLNIDRILQAASSAGADAIHPGYGFLSENPAFARRVEESDLIFVGPSAASMETMGNKITAKETVSAFSIPLVPGMQISTGAERDLKKQVSDIGYPVLIKAAAGGGGKGMRIVQSEKDLDGSLERAASEAQSAFGDPTVFVEKYIENPRHIEVQVLSDEHGNHIHLFERECSIQRRHQKVIEETPANRLGKKTRKALGEAAVKVAESCHYRGAGTVEFLVDDAENFYFLEMNTRLQVEHPVTEMTTGIDLVECQFRIARGEHLPYQQADIQRSGHAIELRVYAEDPSQNFLPSVGTLASYQTPEGDGIRVDNGYREGDEVPIYYDPLLAKLVCCGTTREDAIGKMSSAIKEFYIEGVKNTLEFGLFCMDHKAFREGTYDTHFVSKYFDPSNLESEEEYEAAAVFAKVMFDRYYAMVHPIRNPGANWKLRNRNQ
jgi:acetyl-CoA carboxylase biotin carboxylase subunit